MFSEKLDHKKVYWAKSTGFEPWPSRLCNRIEEESLKKMSQPKDEDQVAVLFFDKRVTRGWVNRGFITEFTPKTMTNAEFFSIKLFNTNRGYRDGVMEGVRVLKQANVEFPVSVLTHMKKFDKDFPHLPLAERCNICLGSKHSGNLRDCGLCDLRKQHWHCDVDHYSSHFSKERWVCKVCCMANNWQYGVKLPENPQLKPFFGEVDGFRTEYTGGIEEQLFGVTYEDGDREEYTEEELLGLLELYEKFKGINTSLALENNGSNSSNPAHCLLGAKVAKFFSDEVVEVEPAQVAVEVKEKKTRKKGGERVNTVQTFRVNRLENAKNGAGKINSPRKRKISQISNAAELDQSNEKPRATVRREINFISNITQISTGKPIQMPKEPSAASSAKKIKMGEMCKNPENCEILKVLLRSKESVRNCKNLLNAEINQMKTCNEKMDLNEIEVRISGILSTNLSGFMKK